MPSSTPLVRSELESVSSDLGDDYTQTTTSYPEGLPAARYRRRGSSEGRCRRRVRGCSRPPLSLVSLLTRRTPVLGLIRLRRPHLDLRKGAHTTFARARLCPVLPLLPCASLQATLGYRKRPLSHPHLCLHERQVAYLVGDTRSKGTLMLDPRRLNIVGKLFNFGSHRTLGVSTMSASILL